MSHRNEKDNIGIEICPLGEEELGRKNLNRTPSKGMAGH
jgi:hypothetical protein